MPEEELPFILKFTLRPGTVYYFAHRALTTVEPHYFVVVNSAPLTQSVLLLAVASSQLDKVRARRRHLPPETLVFLDPSDYNEFSKATVIDCNMVFELPHAELAFKFKEGELKYKMDLPPESLEKVQQGVLASPQVDEVHKQLIRSKPDQAQSADSDDAGKNLF